MKRCIDIIGSAGCIVFFAPLLLFGWLGLMLRHVHPVFIRGDGDPEVPAGFRRFNSSGNGYFPRFLRWSAIDLLPVFFDVLTGAARLGDAFRLLNRTSEIRQRPPTRRELLLRGLLLVVAACIILVLVFFAPESA
jgi:hypothetical protein